mgnify:CR=1 FL=1
MADSEQITSLIKDLEEMKDGLGSLNDLVEGTQEVSDSLLKSFQNFATTGSSATLWGAVSRFSSGIFPGFWSLQNKVRAVAVYMQYVEKKQKEQIQAEGKIAKTIRNQSKVRNEAFRVFELLQKDSLSITEQITLEADAYYSVLKAQLGAEEAKIKYQEAYKSTLVENIDSELRLSRAVAERIRNEDKYAHLFEKVSAGNMKSLEKVLYFREQEEEAQERLLYFEERKQEVADNLYSKIHDEAIPEDEYEKEQYKKEIIALEDQIKELDKEIEKQKLARDTAKGTKDMVAEQEGVRVGYNVLAEEDVFEQDTSKSRDELIKGLSEYVTKYIKSFPLIAKIIATYKWLGKRMNRKLLLGVAGEALKFMGKIMLGFLGISLVVFAIIQSGIIGRIVDLVERLKENKMFKSAMRIINKFLEGIGMIFSGIFDFFYGLFTGDMNKVVGGITKLFKGAIQAVGLIVPTILLGLPGILIPLLFELGQMIGQIVLDFGSYIIGSASNAATGIGALSGAFAGAKIGAAGGPLGILAGAVIGGTLGGIGGAALGDMVGLASGGRVNQGGNILVGEAGPEIVSLPTNSFVTPAVQSRAMMGNNITVQVNGRVGASDSELNEIARKIGQKINREMNKYGSSGYRA